MASLYDPLFGRVYSGIRATSIERLQLDSSDTVLLIGVGTGPDLDLMPQGATVLGVDITQAMLRQAAKRQPRRANLLLADGSALPLATASISAVVLHLVLAVTDNPDALLLETARVLRPGGRVAILDHFARPGGLGWWRRVASRVPRVLGSHLDRRFEDLDLRGSFTVVSDQSLARGNYRAVTLLRT